MVEEAQVEKVMQEIGSTCLNLNVVDLFRVNKFKDIRGLLTVGPIAQKVHR
jgi:hypothetical protein